MNLRLFVAIDLDDRARELVAAAIDLLRGAGLEARFETREKWHVSLAFLGATNVAHYGDVTSALRAAAARCAPFDLTLDTIGAFPTIARPRVVWVGSMLPQSAYAACSAAVRECLTALGFHFENDAVPHATICRLKHAARPLPELSLPGVATVRVDALTLYESIPDGRTTRYAVREKIPLIM